MSFRRSAVLAALLTASVVAPATANAAATDFTIAADRPNSRALEGPSRSFDSSTGAFTTGPQPIATDASEQPHKQIAGAVSARAEYRVIVVRFYLPAGQPVQPGQGIPVNGTLSSGGAGIVLTLGGITCPATAGSFTVNEYAEQADTTPTIIDVSFTATCTANEQEGPVTYTGRYRLNASGLPTAAPTRDTTAPAVSKLRLRPAGFTARRGSSALFTLSEPARVTLAVQRRAAGRRVGRKCRRPTKLNHSRRSCARYVAVRGTVTVDARAGANTVRLPTRLGGRRLSPGHYRLLVAASDAAGNTGRGRHAAFTVRSGRPRR